MALLHALSVSVSEGVEELSFEVLRGSDYGAVSGSVYGPYTVRKRVEELSFEGLDDLLLKAHAPIDTDRYGLTRIDTG